MLTVISYNNKNIDFPLSTSNSWVPYFLPLTMCVCIFFSFFFICIFISIPLPPYTVSVNSEQYIATSCMGWNSLDASAAYLVFWVMRNTQSSREASNRSRNHTISFHVCVRECVSCLWGTFLAQWRGFCPSCAAHNDFLGACSPRYEASSGLCPTLEFSHWSLNPEHNLSRLTPLYSNSTTLLNIIITLYFRKSLLRVLV